MPPIDDPAQAPCEGPPSEPAPERLPIREFGGAGGRDQRRSDAKRLRASLSHFFAWCHEHYGLLAKLEKLPDSRDPARARIPQAAVLLAVLLMYWLRIGSVRALDERLRYDPAIRRALKLAGWTEGISDDTFADVLEGVDLDMLRGILHYIGNRELKRWAAGRYKESILARRLAGVGCAGLVARVLVAIDGHELFACWKRSCPDCRVRKVKQKDRDSEVEVDQHYHTVVVAQWVGAHPAVILDFERILPGEGEQAAAYRLVTRLEEVYGKTIGTLVADAAYDGEPFRRAARKAGYRFVIRHKNKNIDPGKGFKRAVDRRDPDRTMPDQRYAETSSRRRYECWDEADPSLGLRYVEDRRTTRAVRSGEEGVHKGACITDIPKEQAPAVAVAMIMETRWSIESGFHELVGEWCMDRAFVHSGRPTAVLAIVCLAFVAYNAFAAYIYRSLGINPRRPERTFGDVRGDLWITLADFGRKARAHPP
ncbi:MAG: transposase [Cyanobacteria bacterium REEB65]|nr:transposase [Cyanobacteria bacterium REEB65]